MAQTHYTPRVVQTGQVPSTQTNFPALVLLNDARYKTIANGGHVANANGYDIRFYSDSGLTTALTFERVTYSASAGTGEFHVFVASMADAVTVYIGYGDAALSSDASSTSTWNSNYKIVSHFANGSSLSVADSTSNARNGSLVSGSAGTGIIDGGIVFGSNNADGVSYGTAAIPTTGSILLWLYPTWAQTDGISHAIGMNLASGNLFQFIKYSDNSLYCGWYNGSDGRVIVSSASYTLNQNAWNKFVFTWDSAAPASKLFLNNVQIGSTNTTNGTWNTAGAGVDFGHDANTGGSLNAGTFDEFRLMDSVLSVNGGTAAYNNEVANATFWPDGTEVAVGAATGGGPLTKNGELLHGALLRGGRLNA